MGVYFGPAGGEFWRGVHFGLRGRVLEGSISGWEVGFGWGPFCTSGCGFWMGVHFGPVGGGFWRGSISHQQGLDFERGFILDQQGTWVGFGVSTLDQQGLGFGGVVLFGLEGPFWASGGRFWRGSVLGWGVHFGPAGGGFWRGPILDQRGVDFGGGPFPASGGWVLEGGSFQSGVHLGRFIW